ncbi:MAG TPA: hypothetical protein DD396_02965 [Bacteroidetes bacterium]|jgi:hypothetical protein|nr:hypothetical protein [Bacteroidota bacterium]|tara:strand:+ start:2562 stop:2981 length:420 start_codon:yes stop_codon:yes gene_type:complete
MRKITGIIIFVSLIAIASMVSCKDIINIPETAYVDSLAPVVKLISPIADDVFIGQTSIPIHLELSDDYELASVTVRIDPSDITLAPFTLTRDLTGLTTYNLESTYTLPTTKSMVYEVNISALDFVGNAPLPIQYTFTAK